MIIALGGSSLNKPGFITNKNYKFLRHNMSIFLKWFFISKTLTPHPPPLRRSEIFKRQSHTCSNSVKLLPHQPKHLLYVITFFPLRLPSIFFNYVAFLCSFLTVSIRRSSQSIAVIRSLIAVQFSSFWHIVSTMFFAGFNIFFVFPSIKSNSSLNREHTNTTCLWSNIIPTWNFADSFFFAWWEPPPSWVWLAPKIRSSQLVLSSLVLVFLFIVEADH